MVAGVSPGSLSGLWARGLGVRAGLGACSTVPVLPLLLRLSVPVIVAINFPCVQSQKHAYDMLLFPFDDVFDVCLPQTPLQSLLRERGPRSHAAEEEEVVGSRCSV